MEMLNRRDTVTETKIPYAQPSESHETISKGKDKPEKSAKLKHKEKKIYNDKKSPEPPRAVR